jgi:hypothetical protein
LAPCHYTTGTYPSRLNRGALGKFVPRLLDPMFN